MYGEVREAKRLQVDNTSIADLKAELFRKKGEAVKNRQKGNYRPEKQKEKKNNIWSKGNSGLMARIQKDIETKKEEERNNERVKSQLERKSRLYDSLKKGKGKSQVADNFLVQFGGASDSDDDHGGRGDYPANGAGEEWVEYTDALGRTRTCMKKDLPELKRQDKDLKRDEDKDRNDVETGEGLRKEEPDLLSEDNRLDIMREKWEQTEMENLTKANLHYNDVRFDEARMHGAGFYNFSNEEEKRNLEQATLKKLHEETDEMRKQKEKKAKKKDDAMAIRVKKAKAKQRARRGLPAEESESSSEDETGKNGNAESDDEEGGVEDISKSVMEGLKMFRRNNEAEERRKNEARRVATGDDRDWNKDKEEVSDLAGKEWRVMDQREWVTKQREERKKEFAPPSAYSEARWLLKQKEEEALKSRKRKAAQPQTPNIKDVPPPSSMPPPANFFIDTNPSSWGVGGAFQHPPPQMQFSVPPPSVGVVPPNHHHPPPAGVVPAHLLPPPVPHEPVIGPSANPMAYLDSNPELPPLPPTREAPPSNQFLAETLIVNEVGAANQYSKYMKMEIQKRTRDQDSHPQTSGGMNREMLDRIKAFQEESDDSDEEDEDNNEAEVKNRGKEPEVAPPCDMDYFVNTQNKANVRQGFRSHEDMADAFSAGLKAAKK